jgi:hypothetical protein
VGAAIKDEWKKVNWRTVGKRFFSWGRIGQFIKHRVPQIFAIWAAVGALLRAPFFIDAFGWFGKNFNSPFFHVDGLNASQPVDLTPLFLIGFAAMLVNLILIAALYICIEVCRRLELKRPAKLEELAGRFSGKMTDEVSSILTHCSAATLVLLVDARPERYGHSVVTLCLALSAFAFVFAGVCYREE